MIRAAGLSCCGLCAAATDRFERQWRAYFVFTADGERGVIVICPTCAERAYGEDEAAWWN